MTMPVVDEHDVLRNGGRWVALGPFQAKLARALVDHLGEVVPRAALEAAAWADEPVRPNTVDRQIYRLRGQLLAVGLVLHTIRGHGYLLEAATNLTGG